MRQFPAASKVFGANTNKYIELHSDVVEVAHHLIVLWKCGTREKNRKSVTKTVVIQLCCDFLFIEFHRRNSTFIKQFVVTLVLTLVRTTCVSADTAAKGDGSAAHQTNPNSLKP